MDEVPVSRVRKKREEKGLSQQELAKIIGVSAKTISSWENSPSKADNLSRFLKLCRALDCDYQEFLPDHPIDCCGSPLARNRAETIESICAGVKEIVEVKSPIAALRKKQHGMSQEDLAEAVDVDYKTIQNWERDRTARYRHQVISRLCAVLECSQEDLVTYKKRGPTRPECLEWKINLVERNNSKNK